MVQIRIRADLVQRAAQEQLVRGDTVQIERARRHQKDLVGRGREVVLAIAAVFEIRVDRFTRLPEVEHRVADFLDLAPERRLEAGGPQQHRAHARIDFRFAQVVDEAADGRRTLSAQIADHVVRRHFGEIAAHAEHEQRVGRHRRLAPDQQIDQDEAGDRHDERDAEQGEDDAESTTRHG